MTILMQMMALLNKVMFFNPRGDGKYPVVILVLIIVFLGLGGALFYLEKRLRKIEDHRKD